MNELFNSLFGQLKGTGGGSKAVAALVGLAMVIAVSVTAVVSNRPHFEMAFSGLTDHEVARVNKALSENSIAFEVSQPPGPFNVFVDRSARSKAYMAVYGAGALDKPLKGIIAESGVTSVFQGSEERLQAVRKREWQEMEGILEILDFVSSARIRTATSETSVFLRSQAPTKTASVTLRVAAQMELTADQTMTVANLVSRGLGIAKQNLVISDQSGKSLYDGSETLDEGPGPKDLLAIQNEYDDMASAKANQLLAMTLGENKARVTVHSEWDYDQTTRSESTSTKGGVLKESKNTEETPYPAAQIGGSAGLSGNLAGEDEQDPAEPVEPAEPVFAKTEENLKEYQPSQTTVQTVRTTPVLKRLTIAAFFDQSLEEERIPELEEAIKAAVGYDSIDRRDDFKSIRIAFASEPEAEEAVEEGGEAPAEEVSEPNPLIEKLLERGVEILTSLVFLVLLLRSLKRSKPTGDEIQPAGSATAKAEDGLDPEMLARAQIDELLKSDPQKVGDILSSWARHEQKVGSK